MTGLAGEKENINQYKESYNVPMSKLSVSTLKWLSHKLNVPMRTLSPNNKLLQDWRGLAEIFGCGIIDIENIQLSQDPCYEMLTQYAAHRQSSIYELLDALQKIERFDIIADEDLYDKIGKDCEKVSDIIQVSQVSCSKEVVPFKEERNYTAFVCHHPDDILFVKMMAEVLEEKNGFTLFIPERDQIAGVIGIDNLVKLIKSRCQKMLVVLSPRFLQSPDCNFQISYAMAIDIMNKERKIIPIIYESCEMPDILTILSKVDYTREGIRDWFWKRLVASISPPADIHQNLINLVPKDSAIGSSNASINKSLESKHSTGGSTLTCINKGYESKDSTTGSLLICIKKSDESKDSMSCINKNIKLDSTCKPIYLTNSDRSINESIPFKKMLLSFFKKVER